jgi:hypothetical protein
LIATRRPEYFAQLKAWLPVYEGFITYGGMSSKEIEAMAVGLREMVDPDIASSSADLIEDFVNEMVKFYEEPPVLRFFTGRLRALDDWGCRLVEALVADFGEAN